VAEENSTPYVARAADLDALQEHWAAARSGEPRIVRMHAPLGGGKRAIAGELSRRAVAEDEDTLVWRAVLSDETDGLQNLIRLYAGLFQALHRSPSMRGRVEMALNAQLPHEPRRTQGWYQAFIEGLKKGAPKAGDSEFQVILPRDNPLVGLVEITIAIARKFPIMMDIQNVHHAHSLGLVALLEALLDELIVQEEEKFHLMILLGLGDLDETAKMSWSLPLQDFLTRREEDLDVHTLSPWGAEEVGLYLSSRDLESDAENIARIADGRPGFIAELIDWLKDNDKLGDDLSSFSLADVADVTPDADELEGDDDDDDDTEEEASEDKAPTRRKAGAEDAENVAFTAALLGLTFPSGLVADLRGLERDSVDDLLDATDALYKELQFSKPLGTWIYQYHRALLRESVLVRHASDEDKQHRVLVARAMEQALVPRGYAYVVKTARMYAEGGEAGRASLMRSMALASDQPQMWAMCHDLTQYFDEVSWPDALRRTVFLQLLDRMMKQGGKEVERSETLFNEAMEWATGKEDRTMQAVLLFMGSQLDMRRQDLYRARDRANDALKLFTAMEDKNKQGEVHAHLATIELNDGNINAALDQARLAEEIAPTPPMQAQAEFVRGHAARRDPKRIQEAVDHFRKSNEIAGRAGLGPQALQAGLAFGETLLASRQPDKAADVLSQVQRIAGQLQNAPQERAACTLLGQAQAGVGNFEAALTAANRALELTRALKFNQFEPFDLFNVALFNLRLKRPTEAVSLFRQAREKANVSDQRFMKELQFNMGMAMVQIGQRTEGAEALRASVTPATQARDWAKVVAANRTLSDLERVGGNTTAARRHLEGAIKAAEAGGMKDLRKQLRRQLDTLR